DPAAFDEAWQFIARHFGDLYAVRENVAGLRKAILQLAVMGKLVPQDQREGTAGRLLEGIKRDKVKLVKEGKIKTEKPLTPIKTEEMPFIIPSNWMWVRMGEISTYIQRGKGPVYSDVQSVPVISQKCVQWTGFNPLAVRFV